MTSSGTKKSKNEPKNGGRIDKNSNPISPTKQDGSIGPKFLHTTILPMCLMVSTPLFGLFMWMYVYRFDSSIDKVVTMVQNDGALAFGSYLLESAFTPSRWGVQVVGVFSIFQLVIMALIPGKRFTGPTTESGHVPVYKDNGFVCYIISVIAFLGVTKLLEPQFFLPSQIILKYDEILATCNVFGLSLVLFMVVKGMVFPSNSDASSSGNFVFDFYWGTELYPRIFGLDLKVFTNCRFGMTAWVLVPLSAFLHLYKTQGFVNGPAVSTILILVYMTKFFWWEAGYMGTMDICFDRAGFYLCWGCMNWVPSFYCSPFIYICANPLTLSDSNAFYILSTGVMAIVINYMIDKEKMVVRASNGQKSAWFPSKPRVIRAPYTYVDSASGKLQKRESLLIYSGLWGIARHFHYVPELLHSLCWSLTSGLTSIAPFAYFLFLFVLLMHRSVRDDIKCQKKYGDSWNRYKKLVPYRVIPYVF